MSVISVLEPQSAEIEAILKEASEQAWLSNLEEWKRDRAAKLASRKIKAIYTDGSGKSGENCGYGVSILFASGKTYELAGREENSTNQRAELLAVITALEFIQHRDDRNEIEIFSDSAYVVNGYNDRWVDGWSQRGWLSSDKKPVANKDLWKRLEELRGAKLSHLKGHSDRGGKDGSDRRKANFALYGDLADQHNRGNVRADQIAGFARKNGAFERDGGYLSDVWDSPRVFASKTRSIAPLAAKSSESFEERISHRAIFEAGLTESVFDSNIKFFDRQDTYDRLGWEIPRRGGFRLLPNANSFGFINEDGSSFQHQLEKFREDKKDGKPIKYESVRGKGAQIFRASVPADIRRKMFEKFGVDVPETGSFWHWFATSPEARKLPLVVTEGGWKALSILSLGIPAISLYGCSAGFQSRESRYDKRRLCVMLAEIVAKHEVTIAFDSDEKLSTRRKVGANIRILGEAISANASAVKIAVWESSQGKGADDFIHLQGGLAFETILKSAIDLKTWKSADSIQFAQSILKAAATLKADIVANQRWVSDCDFPLPKLGQAVLVDSAMFTGKSTWFKTVIAALVEIYPDLLIELIGSRNNLLRQSASPEKLNLRHIADLEAGEFTQRQIDASIRLAYCIDSLPRRYDRLIQAAQNGQKFLIILDEIDAVLTHLLTSSTIGPIKRIQIIGQFATLLRLVADGHGFIIGGEANLSGLAVQALSEWTDGKLDTIICRNAHKPPQWEVIDHSQASAAANKQGALVLAEQLLAEGKKVLLITTSQEAGEQFDACIDSRYSRVRIDSKSSSDPEIRSMIQDFDAFLNPKPKKAAKTEDKSVVQVDELDQLSIFAKKQAPIAPSAPKAEVKKAEPRQISLVIGTPTIENGVSIDADYFDAVILYAANGEPRQLHQILGRNRPPSPRYLFVTATGTQTGRGLNTDTLIRKWEANSEKAIGSLKLEDKQIEAVRIAQNIAADFFTRTEAGSMTLRLTLHQLLKKDGHIIKPKSFKVPEGTGERIKQAKEFLIDEFITLWQSLDDSLITAKQARQMLKQELRYEEQLIAQKALQRGKFGALVDGVEFIEHYWAQGYKSKRNRRSIDSRANYEHPDMASERDAADITRQIEATGTLWKPSYASREAVVSLLKRLQFDAILNLPEGSLLHSQSAPVVLALIQAKKNAVEVKEVLGLTITEKTTAIGFVNDVLRGRLGAEVSETKITLPDEESDKCHPKRHNDISLGHFRGHLSQDPPETPITEGEAEGDHKCPPKRYKGESRKRRPKGQGKGKRIKAYQIVHFPYREEIVSAIAVEHERDKNELEQAFQANEAPGQVVEIDGEQFTVVSATAKAVRLVPSDLDVTDVDCAITLSREEIASQDDRREIRESA